MGRIIAIDYGRKRCGVAVTDVLKIAANGLPTQRTCDLMGFLQNYVSKEPVERIVVGLPKTLSEHLQKACSISHLFFKSSGKCFRPFLWKLFDERFTPPLPIARCWPQA